MGVSSAIAYLTIGACISSFIAVILHAITFATPHWLESDGKSPFDSIGFHEACFTTCRHPYCPGGDPSVIYDGCWWIYNEYFREIWQWIRIDWYMKARNLVIINIPLSAIGWILTILCSCAVVIAGRYTSLKRNKHILLAVILFITCAFLSCSGLICVYVCASFYLNAFKYGWMPLPEKNHLGYSYWLEVVSAALLCFGACGLFLAGVFQIFSMDKEKGMPYADDMVMEATDTPKVAPPQKTFESEFDGVYPGGANVAASGYKPGYSTGRSGYGPGYDRSYSSANMYGRGAYGGSGGQLDDDFGYSRSGGYGAGSYGGGGYDYDD